MDVTPVFRSEVETAIKQPRETREYFTKYEYGHRIIGI